MRGLNLNNKGILNKEAKPFSERSFKQALNQVLIENNINDSFSIHVDTCYQLKQINVDSPKRITSKPIDESILSDSPIFNGTLQLSGLETPLLL